MKIGIALATALFVLGIVLGLIQLWFAPWSPALFLKLEMTVGALLIAILVVGFVVREYKEDKANRSGDRLDR